MVSFIDQIDFIFNSLELWILKTQANFWNIYKNIRIEILSCDPQGEINIPANYSQTFFSFGILHTPYCFLNNLSTYVTSFYLLNKQSTSE